MREIPFHAAYIVFSLVAAWAMWSLACRFSEHLVWATLLFIAVPAFVINGGSLEADLPFLAFWMASIALFSAGQLSIAALAMAAAAMMAYQAVFLIPILAIYCWLYHRRDKLRWAILATPLLTVIAWQLFTRFTTGTMPAGKLAEYFDHYGFQAIEHKLKSALMLAIHAGWIIFPALLPVTAIQAWRRRREPGTHFLLAWIALYFAGAVVLFFSGSARYLLPMAAPACILASRTGSKWLAPSFVLQLALALALATVNYQHWDGYRAFAAALRAPTAGKRVWVDNDWGLRYYLESDHALPARKGQHVRSGDIVVTSELGHNVEFKAPLTLFTSETIESSIPLRLIGLNSHSGYSTVEEGFLPFGISGGPIDRVLARVVKERRVTQEYLKIHSPEASEQIVDGIDASDGWTSKSASVVLKRPAAPRTLRAEFYIPRTRKRAPSHSSSTAAKWRRTPTRALARTHWRRPNRFKVPAWRSAWTRRSPHPATSVRLAWCSPPWASCNDQVPSWKSEAVPAQRSCRARAFSPHAPRLFEFVLHGFCPRQQLASPPGQANPGRNQREHPPDPRAYVLVALRRKLSLPPVDDAIVPVQLRHPR